MSDQADYSTLRRLLQERLRVIADQAARTASPEAHLESLKQVSLAIEKEHQELKSRLGEGMDARLDHFLGHCSYEKALAQIDLIHPTQSNH